MSKISGLIYHFQLGLQCRIFPAVLLLTSQSLLADTQRQQSEAYYLFYPNPSNGQVEQIYQPRSAKAQNPLQQRPNYLRHNADNPLFKLWLEKEIKKHKNR
ncbi:MAG: hypothetical protein ACOH5I_05405 [Oligoflexus sp.]